MVIQDKSLDSDIAQLARVLRQVETSWFLGNTTLSNNTVYKQKTFNANTLDISSKNAKNHSSDSAFVLPPLQDTAEPIRPFGWNVLSSSIPSVYNEAGNNGMTPDRYQSPSSSASSNGQSTFTSGQFTDVELHTLVINAIGFIVEAGALVTNLWLLGYAGRRIWMTTRSRRATARIKSDITFGTALHLALVGSFMAVFMTSMHLHILVKGPPSTTVSTPSTFDIISYNATCVYYLYIRDTLASVYLYLLVVHLMVYTRVRYPPRIPQTTRWKSIFVLVHSLPWVLAIGAALPVCILNLGDSALINNPLIPKTASKRYGSSSFNSIHIVRGLCILNTKFDVASLLLEMIQLTVPVMMCLGILSTICVQRCSNSESSVASNQSDASSGLADIAPNMHLSGYTLNGHSHVSYSPTLVLLSSGLVLITQAPFAFTRLATAVMTIVHEENQRTLRSYQSAKYSYPSNFESNSYFYVGLDKTLMRYFTALHIVLFSVIPVVILMMLMLLRSSYEKVERVRHLASKATNGVPHYNPNHIDVTHMDSLNMDNELGEVLYTNCMLTTV